MDTHSNAEAAGRVLLLTTNHTYRDKAFMNAAERLGVDVVQAIDMPSQLAEHWHVILGLDFANVEASSAKIAEFAEEHPIQSIISIDDSGALLAAHASAQLGLPHNDVKAAEAARDKHVMRQLLSHAGVPSPRSQRFATDDDLNELLSEISFPCVVKPLRLSGSRGVIRADNQREFAAAVARLKKILDRTSTGPHPFLVEDFVPGVEVAVEGMLAEGQLTVLALFDKPDPLDGPFFEETIYVTPSRLSPEVQDAIAVCTAQAAAALGLRTGSIHAELRVNEQGPWIVEIAGRSIGGLCSQTLRFGSDVSLEELILRQACHLPIESLERQKQATGVMMIPIPEAGMLKGIDGREDALAVPLVSGLEITAKLNYPIVPLPEGESYLGFIFASGETPAAVEYALRQAHSKLRFRIEPHIQLTLVQS